jgi:hypothetical protein
MTKTATYILFGLAANALGALAIVTALAIIRAVPHSGNAVAYGNVAFFGIWPIMALLTSFAIERRYLGDRNASVMTAALIAAASSAAILPSLLFYLALDPSGHMRLGENITALSPYLLAASAVLIPICFCLGIVASWLRSKPAIAYYSLLGALSLAVWGAGIFVYTRLMVGA